LEEADIVIAVEDSEVTMEADIPAVEAWKDTASEVAMEEAATAVEVVMEEAATAVVD
jgi:hypothetical protein